MRKEAPLLGAVVVGAWLRLDQIREQILLDDEWHALHAIVRFGYARLLTHFGWTDVCIPLAVYDKLLADTLGLSEMWVRLPVLLAGIASLVILPLLVRPWVGRAASHAFAWLLAISPLHVFFSRFARPYAISLLLVAGGGLAFAAWWEGKAGDRSRRLAVGGFVLGPYFHLAVLPAVLAPLGVALVDAWLGRGREGARGRTVAEALRVVGLVALGLAVLIGVPLAVDHGALAYKTGRGAFAASTLRGAAELLAGTARPWALALVALAAAAGLASLARVQGRFLVLLGSMALAGPAAIVVSRPAQIGEAIVLARYGLVALPVLLLLVAVALTRAEERLPLPRGALVALSVAGLLWLGPLPRTWARPNNWTNHGWFQYAYDPARLGWSCPAEVPRFYRDLAAQPPGSLRILEAPWWHAWDNVYYPCYQRVHRQYMAIGFVAGPAGAMSKGGLPRAAELPILATRPSFRFRNFIHVDDAAALRRAGIRYVVFHKDLGQEMGVDSPDFQKADVGRWLAHYRSLYGPPAYEDDVLAAFDLLAAGAP